jgi:hypothetical protein
MRLRGRHSLSKTTTILNQEELFLMILKKKLLASGLTLAMMLGGLTACGDGVDQDNGVTDGEEKDELDEEDED